MMRRWYTRRWGSPVGERGGGGGIIDFERPILSSYETSFDALVVSFIVARSSLSDSFRAMTKNNRAKQGKQGRDTCAQFDAPVPQPSVPQAMSPRLTIDRGRAFRRGRRGREPRIP